MELIDRGTLLAEMPTIESEYKYARKIIQEQPTVDAELVRHGKWTKIPRTDIGAYWNDIGTCSCCGDKWGSVSVMNYCPNCGARMDADD